MKRMSELPKNRSVPIPTVIPVLPYPDVREAVHWLTEVFGFRERLQITDHRSQMHIDPDGAMIVAEYIDRDQRPTPGADYVSHKTMVRVADVRAHYERSKAGGAEIIEPPVDHMFGERQYEVRDLGGHRWTFSQTLEDVHPDEWGGEGVSLKTAE